MANRIPPELTEVAKGGWKDNGFGSLIMRERASAMAAALRWACHCSHRVGPLQRRTPCKACLAAEALQQEASHE